MPREESFPVPLKYIDVTRTTDTSLGVMLEKNIIDYWNVDGDRELSGAWTGVPRFTFLKERNHRMGKRGPGGDGRENKRPLESWNFRCQQQCLVKLHCAEAAGEPAALLENTRQNTLALLKLTNL